MRVLVTGGAGLVGSAIARHAAERGNDVTRIWHSMQPEPITGVRDVRCDLGDPAGVSSLPTEVEAVIHTAARIPAGDWSDESAAAANRSVDQALLQHYDDAGYSGRWVFLSTVALERADSRGGPYAAEKAEAEDRILGAFPGRARSLRLSSPYGRGMRHMNVLRRFAQAALSGTPLTLLGSGERTQDFVHVDDIAAAALAAIDAPGGGPLVIASGEPVSMADLAQRLVAITGSSSPIERTGRPDPQDGFRADYDLHPAFEALGWAASIRLDAGLRSMVEAM